MNSDDLAFDYHHIWHPYSSMSKPLPCYPIVSAMGVHLLLADGRKLVDGMSSWWAAIHGYNHPSLNHALRRQISQMSHVMFGGITHPAAIALCRRLVAMSPVPLECVFLADSGSVAIEVAMKMALQYWQALGKRRERFLALRRGYHGDTFFAMSVCDPDNSMHKLWKGYLPKALFAPEPKCSFSDNWEEEDISGFISLIKEHAENIAAVILEPIVQGAGGMYFYHPRYLQRVRELCDYYQILLIADEIATGFGRTGKLFACDHSGITPDILCLGKALTGGTMSLSATLTTREIANTISNGAAGCFMHGPTFMGNPLACAVADASLVLLQEGKWKSQVAEIERGLRAALLPLASHPQIKDVRVLGAIGVIESRRLVNVAAIQRFFVNQGVWIRPFGYLIYLIPPYITDEENLAQLTRAISEALKHHDLFF